MRGPSPIVLLVVVGVSGCSPSAPIDSDETDGDTTSSGEGESAETETDSDSETESETESDTDSDTETDSNSETESDTDSETGDGDGFEAIPCPDAAPDVLTERLCPDSADPESAPDKVYIPCEMEFVCFAPADPAPVAELTVMAWNIERGLTLDAQLAAFANAELPMPDVLLLSEVDRGCSRTDNRNVLWEYAEVLGMNGAYGVEFVELPREGGSGGTIEAPCEHGNAVLSRFPIGNASAIRHVANKSWYDNAGEPRLGGRVLVSADVQVGDAIVHLSALHFESAVEDEPIRNAQASEVAEFWSAVLEPVVVGGDLNSGFYATDVFIGDPANPNDATVGNLVDGGFLDAHLSLPAGQRVTHDPLLVLDLILTEHTSTSMPGICSLAQCDQSDHAPIWARVAVR